MSLIKKLNHMSLKHTGRNNPFLAHPQYQVVFEYTIITAIPRFVRPSECTNSLCTSYSIFLFLKITMKHPSSILLQILKRAYKS